MGPVLFKVSDESINSYGFRLLSSGGDFTRFKMNPIALYNHMRPWKGTEDEILPIGTWSDLKVHDNGDITAMFNPDMDEEFSAKVAKKIEKKIIVAASVGIFPLEWSEDPKDLLPGQRYATITKWELREISPCDIPSNANAVQLYDQQGQAINLSDQGAIPIPKLQAVTPEGKTPINSSQKNTMDLKSLCLALGLAEDAHPSTIELAVNKLKDKLKLTEAENAKIKGELADLKVEEAKQLVELALTDKRIVPAQKEAFIELFNKDFDNAKAVLQSMQPTIKLSDIPGAGGQGPAEVKHEGMTFSELSKKHPAKLLKLKTENFEMFKALFTAEYGTEYKS